MTTIYDILFSIAVDHGYYRQGRFPGFRYIPAPFTSRTLSKNGMCLTDRYGRIQLSIPVEKNEGKSLLHYTVAEQFSLIFLVHTSDIYLENISVFPERKAPEILLFSNTQTVATETDSHQLDIHTVLLAGNQLRIPKTEWQGNTINDSYGNTTELIPDETDTEMIYSLSGWDEDLYYIPTQNGNRYFCNITSGWEAPPLALLHIVSNPTLLDQTSLLSPEYRIRVEPPAPFWKYILPLHAVSRYTTENLTIEASDHSITFEKTLVNNTEPILVFTSSVPLLLENKKDIRFQLKHTHNHDIPDSIILPDLPFPDPGTLMDRKGDPLTTSIFIKV